jgi:hypothetical protein
MSYGDVQAKKKEKKIDYVETVLFEYRGSDPSYRRSTIKTGHVYHFFPKNPESVVNLSDLDDLLSLAKKNKNLFNVGIGFTRISQKAYNNQAEIIEQGIKMAKEAGFDKKIITKAEKELKAKVEAVEE